MTEDAAKPSLKEQAAQWLFSQAISTVLLVGLAVYVVHRDEKDRDAKIIELQSRMATCEIQRAAQQETIEKLSKDLNDMNFRVLDLMKRGPER